jgi:flavin-dependent dehydrogenase
MGQRYDVIVVGARCAGSPTAMLLARKRYRVLLVDRATFPSDTLSTHVVQPLGAAALARWGLLDRLVSTGCPPIHTYVFDFGPFTIAGAPGTNRSPFAYCPRRIVLDKLLVEAAAEAGAEVREGFTVDEMLIEDGRVAGIRGRSEDGRAVTERAAIVIGADGRNSLIARTAVAEQYNQKPPLLAAYYSYWSGLPMNGRMEIHIRPQRGFGVMETHDGQTVIVAGWPAAEFEVNKKDVEGNYLKTIALAPEFAGRLHHAKREARIFGALLGNFFRKPYGPGWALVGDAGYHKDSITAQGITDAFHDAELCANAVDQAFTGARSFDEAFGNYQHTRDERVLPIYELTCQLATLEPPPPDMQQLLAAIQDHQSAMDGFARMNAGTISPAQFFSMANVEAASEAA